MKQVLIFVIIILIKNCLGNNQLNHNECIHRGESRISENGCFKFHFDIDGDLVVEDIKTGLKIWNAGIGSNSSVKVCLSSEYPVCKFEVLNGKNKAIWSTDFKRGIICSRTATIKNDGQFQFGESFTTKNRGICFEPLTKNYKIDESENLSIQVASLYEDLVYYKKDFNDDHSLVIENARKILESEKDKYFKLNAELEQKIAKNAVLKLMKAEIVSKEIKLKQLKEEKLRDFDIAKRISKVSDIFENFGKFIGVDMSDLDNIENFEPASDSSQEWME